jgi:hypothetical protein
MKNLHILLIPFIIFALSACGGGSSSSSDSDDDIDYPDVAGRYSFNTDDFDFICSDGASGVEPPITLTLNITQDENDISFINETVSERHDISGITFIESTGLNGNVEEDGSFIATEIATVLIDGISGDVTITYNLSGQFNGNEWSGTYVYDAVSSIGSCSFITSFTGLKASSKLGDLYLEEKFYVDYPVDIYDSFSVIGSSIALD